MKPRVEKGDIGTNTNYFTGSWQSLFAFAQTSPCSSFWMVCSTPGKIFHGLWVFKYFGHHFLMDLLFLGNPYPGRGGRLFAGEKE